MIALYSIAIEIVTWLVLVPWALLRDRTHLRERLGIVDPLAPSKRALIHAASAGEMHAASALVHEMGARGWAFVLSGGNRDALRIAERIAAQHPEVERIVAFPWDRRGAMRRWIAALRPCVVIVMETEIWPNLLRACGSRVVFAGARIEPRAARRYRLFRRFFEGMLRDALVLTIDERERRHFLEAGAKHVEVAGDLKADACAHDIAAVKRDLVLAASTHPGEEELIARELAGLEVAIAPRHVDRTLDLPGARVIREMGALAREFAAARVVIIGGTFVPVGGHDPLTPARYGCALVAGPHIEHIRAHESVLHVVTPSTLRATVERLMRDADEGARARAYAESLQGAAKRCADRIEESLSLDPSP